MTIWIDDQYLKKAKAETIQLYVSLSALIEPALRQRLTDPGRTRLATVSGNGLQSGIDLGGSAPLVEILHEFDASCLEPQGAPVS
ncbi:MAG: hypothetical protein HC802_13725 [Caldilineaceae bacterium]|nr:hypothetical protein [Caldilineaceae bacterium]